MPLKNTLRLAVLATLALTTAAGAGPLTDRLDAGEPIRIGYTEYAPWSYTGENGEALGFVNVYAIELFKSMGHENIEAVSMDWGALTPALKAGRVDVNTGGMYINKDRCKNVAFANPMMRASFDMVVQAGNPKELLSIDDAIEKDAILAGFSGGGDIIGAREAGVPDANIMALPGLTEILAALRANRADFAILSTARLTLKDEPSDDFEVSAENVFPDNVEWPALAFRLTDADFVEAVDDAQAGYIGTEAMLEALAPFGYAASMLPGDDVSTAALCADE